MLSCSSDCVRGQTLPERGGKRVDGNLEVNHKLVRDEVTIERVIIECVILTNDEKRVGKKEDRGVGPGSVSDTHIRNGMFYM